MTIEPNITLEDLTYSIENNFFGGDFIRLFEFPQLLDILFGIIFQKKQASLFFAFKHHQNTFLSFSIINFKAKTTLILNKSLIQLWFISVHLPL